MPQRARQRALADARLAADQRDAPMTGQGGGQLATEQGLLAVATN
jgi:hypothetical protein